MRRGHGGAAHRSRKTLTNMTTMIDAWTKRRTYRRTLAELRALPIDSLLDLDLHRGDLSAVAHRAVYGR